MCNSPYYGALWPKKNFFHCLKKEKKSNIGKELKLQNKLHEAKLKNRITEVDTGLFFLLGLL